MREKQAAYRLSRDIERALAGHDVQPRDAALFDTALRLAKLGQALPGVPEDLRGRVRAIVDTAKCASTGSPAEQQPGRILAIPRWAGGGQRRLRRAIWAIAGLVGLLLVASVIVPGGQRAWASMARSLLGRTRVELTPKVGSETRSVREPLRDLIAVELLIGRAPAVPKAVPEGCALQEIAAVSFPDLPAWISQPLYVELCYGAAEATPIFCLREYRLAFRQTGRLDSVQVAGDVVTEFEQVDIGGVPGALLTMTPRDETTDGQPVVEYTVLWERDGLLLELHSRVLTKEGLLETARSVR